MKISILGCGSIGTRHAKNLLELGYSVNYIFDPIRNNSEILSKKIIFLLFIDRFPKNEVIFLYNK